MDKYIVEYITIKKILVCADRIEEAIDIARTNYDKTYGKSDYTITKLNKDTTLAALDDVDLVVKSDQ